MSFFKKIFGNNKKPKKNIEEDEKVTLTLDDAFVFNFISKGGKFLYCTTTAELTDHLNKIFSENNWDSITCFDENLLEFAKKTQVTSHSSFDNEIPFFTTCEHLISDNGDILFSSNQLSTHKISSLTQNFIVFAKTSQFVRNTGEGLTGIKTNCKENIPTNISAVKKYTLNSDEDNFLNYGNNNSKNLYLLLLEDL